MLRALSRKFPQARVRLIVQSLCSEAAALIPWVDDLTALQRLHRTAPANAKFAAALSSSSCDLLVDLNPSFSRAAAVATSVVRSPMKAGFHKGRLDELFTHHAQAPGAGEHILDRYARLAALLDAPYEPRLELRLNPADEARAARVVSGLGLPAGPRVLIHAGSFHRLDRRWEKENFVTLIDRVTRSRPDIQLVFLSGAGEQRQTEELSSRLKRSAYALPALPLGVIGALMRLADLCVLNVMSTTQLAAGMGMPTFGFYSGCAGAVWRPRGSQHAGVTAREWNSCRGVTVDQAWAALEPVLPPAQ